jgi:hypothetical protein
MKTNNKKINAKAQKDSPYNETSNHPVYAGDHVKIWKDEDFINLYFVRLADYSIVEMSPELINELFGINL